MTELELPVLQLLRLKGRTTIDVITTALAAPASDVAECVDAIAARGLVKQSTTLRVTPAGRTRLAELLADERSRVDHRRLTALYGEFGPFNQRLKDLVTSWQIRPDGSVNAHDDEEYDQGIIDRVAELNGEFGDCLGRIADAAPRLSIYPARFDDAIANVAGGDHRYLVAPIIDSYHTVWFELHEDLIDLQGTTRGEEAAHGRA